MLGLNASDGRVHAGAHRGLLDVEGRAHRGLLGIDAVADIRQGGVGGSQGVVGRRQNDACRGEQAV